MKGAEVVVAMMTGKAPFDAKAVDAAFAQWADTAQKLPSLFPRRFQDRRRQPRLAEDLGEQERLRRQGG